MALKRPGTASNLTFLITSFWALVMIVVLVAGHLTMAFLAYAKFTGSAGMPDIAKFTGMPSWLLWLAVVGGLALDAWIIYHQRLERKKVMRR